MKKASLSSVVGYLFPPVDNLIKGVIILAAGIVTTVLERNPYIMIIFALLAIIELIPDIAKIARFLSQINYYKSRKEIKDIISDFAEAKDHMNSQLKIGKKYIFGKKAGRIVPYSDIKKMHHFVRINYSYSRKRFIEIFTLEGTKVKLCKVGDTEELKSMADDVLVRVRELAPDAEISA